MPKLEYVLQSLIDSGINITVSGVWDNGVNFSFVSLKSAIAHDTGHPEDIVLGEVVDWQNVPKPMLAEVIDVRARPAEYRVCNASRRAATRSGS